MSERNRVNPWRFALALVVAGLWSNPFTVEPYRRFWRALKAMLGFIGKGERVSAEREAMRLTICHSCPIYCATLDTCGSPLKKLGSGCSCYVPVIAKLADKQCWLDEQFPEGDAPWGWRMNGC